jgi:hypothetical protein
MMTTKKEAESVREEMLKHPGPQASRIDWGSTVGYWTDPREQRTDAYGRRPIDRRACVYVPAGNH